MKLYLIAGEASGDNHGAALMQSLRRFQPNLKFSGRGGPQMKRIAGESFLDWSEQAAVVGLWEVIKHYRYFRREFRRTLREIQNAGPDAVVLIDYPGFNLRLACALHEGSLGGKLIYYISPQVWAWNRSRVPRMARWLDLMLCIFPFEAELYERSGLRAIFVGHPMIENLEAKRTNESRDRNLVGLFPGSRGREVRKLMPIFAAAMRELRTLEPALRFEIAAASEGLAQIIREQLEPVGDSLGKVRLTVGEAAETMQRSGTGIVASGTATLEAAFFRMPFVLVYKVAGPTYLAGRMLIQVPHLGMPNVLAGREIVPEFIQHKADPRAIAREVLRLRDEPTRREQMLSDFEDVISKLGKGRASDTAAQVILQTLRV